jgi:glutamate synthase domain-containing protein 1
VQQVEHRPGLLHLELAAGSDAVAVRDAIERPTEDFEVVSFGSEMELVKQVGHPDELDETFDIAAIRGTHGIGHTRLSTESRVDLSHSQPFWVRGVADMATVHNGHITNYHRLRTIYEQRGVRFFTENDSEVVGVYLADQLAGGATLEEALARSLRDLDGSFSYLVATADAIGYARDPYALKPLITVETPDYIAVANEELAIRSALGSAGVAHEPSGNVYRVWQRTRAPLAAVA